MSAINYVVIRICVSVFDKDVRSGGTEQTMRKYSQTICKGKNTMMELRMYLDFSENNVRGVLSCSDLYVIFKGYREY